MKEKLEKDLQVLAEKLNHLRSQETKLIGLLNEVRQTILKHTGAIEYLNDEIQKLNEPKTKNTKKVP